MDVSSLCLQTDVGHCGQQSAQEDTPQSRVTKTLRALHPRLSCPFTEWLLLPLRSRTLLASTLVKPGHSLVALRVGRGPHGTERTDEGPGQEPGPRGAVTLPGKTAESTLDTFSLPHPAGHMSPQCSRLQRDLVSPLCCV